VTAAKTTHAVRFTSDGVSGAVTVDGVDVSSAVRGVRINASAGELVSVELDVIAVEVDMVGAETDVLLPDATRDLLIRLGWTPPTA
jgi:hypothetical protein